MSAARFVVCYATEDGTRAVLHAYADGEGSLRDDNHAAEIVREFARGNEDAILTRPPAVGERVLFEVFLSVRATRRGMSTYFGCDYQMREGCPHCVAVAGMEIYEELKRLLRRARRTRDARRAGKEGAA